MSKGQNDLLKAALRRRSQQRQQQEQRSAQPIVKHQKDVQSSRELASVEEISSPATLVEDDEPIAGPIADTKIKEDNKLHAKLLEVGEIQQLEREALEREEKSKQPKKEKKHFEHNLMEFDIPEELHDAFRKVQVGTDRIIFCDPINVLQGLPTEEIYDYIHNTLLKSGVKVDVHRGSREGRYRAIAIKTV